MIKNNKIDNENYWNFSHLFPKDILENIWDVEFLSYGYHNISFKAKYQNSKVIIRVPFKSFKLEKLLENEEKYNVTFVGSAQDDYLVNHKNEGNFYKQSYDLIYYKNGVYIKKFIEGSTLETIDFSKQENDWIKEKVIKKLKEFHSKKLENIDNFDWFTYRSDDPKFKELVEKYKDDELNLIHGDLAAKNIILDKNNNIHFIDYEWVRYGNRAFDIISLKNLLKLTNIQLSKEFGIEMEVLKDFEYLKKIFDKDAYKKVYDKLNEYNTTSLSKYKRVYKLGQYLFKVLRESDRYTFDTTLIESYNLTPIIYYRDKNYEISEFIYKKQFGRYVDMTTPVWNAVLKLSQIRVKSLEGVKFDELPVVIYINNYYKDKPKKRLIAFILNQVRLHTNLTHLVHYDIKYGNHIYTENKKVKFVDFTYASIGDISYNYANIASSLRNHSYDQASIKKLTDEMKETFTNISYMACLVLSSLFNYVKTKTLEPKNKKFTSMYFQLMIFGLEQIRDFQMQSALKLKEETGDELYSLYVKHQWSKFNWDDLRKKAI
ncbi:phosphotransferase [Mycoplasma crocodyli]|uniref:Choline/ethanolamine kinase n=1 Tax=Mycoplasma crocodyli (strain ATCC 51981 / MP145) TaxID=512564 RepID=D5E5R6_MYCCM|nr:phosphotransferase [Mycoplasma crocodyli]ADE19833.1 choline/ethanolamine kinase [Mycoplasma crocodyli MP145]